MLLILALIVLLLWGGGFALHVGGDFIHLLVLVLLVLLVLHFLRGQGRSL